MIDAEFLTKVLKAIDDWRHASPEYIAENMIPYLTPCGGCGARIDEHCRRQEHNCFRAYHDGKFEKIDF